MANPPFLKVHFHDAMYSYPIKDLIFFNVCPATNIWKLGGRMLYKLYRKNKFTVNNFSDIIKV